jgi:hypothetical protein
MHVLLTVLQATLRALGDAPTQSMTELAHRIGVAETEASALVVQTEGLPTLSDPSAPVPAAPLVATMALSDASSAPRIRLSRRTVIAARKNVTR